MNKTYMRMLLWIEGVSLREHIGSEEIMQDVALIPR